MEFVLIPAGRFLMGAGADDEDICICDRRPQHEMSISKAFYLGKYPVTQKEWEEVMGSNPSFFQGADHPVEMVSWEEVQKFIKKPNEREGRDGYRLPTEAEWEYACRAGSTTRYSFGDDAGQLKEYGWYAKNSGDQTHPVGGKKPNAWGLYGMHGNVWEWVSDWYGEYQSGAVTDPAGPSSGSERVLRGGSWSGNASSCQSAYRAVLQPHFRPRPSVGFRLVLVP